MSIRLSDSSDTTKIYSYIDMTCMENMNEQIEAALQMLFHKR